MNANLDEGAAARVAAAVARLRAAGGENPLWLMPWKDFYS